MEIKGFIKHSLVDWDGKISCVIFLPYCTFRCPWCYARDLVVVPETLRTIELEKILAHIREHKDFIDGCVITGGEPTLHPDLPELCRELKKLVLVKVDSNGTNPGMLRKLVDEKLVDYFAMDIKGPLDEESYNRINGNKDLLDSVKESIKYIMGCGVDYEFRTTCVPGLHDEKSIEAIGEFIKGARKWALQNFMVPHEKGKLIDPAFEKVRSFSSEEMDAMQKAAKKYVSNTIVRGV